MAVPALVRPACLLLALATLAAWGNAAEPAPVITDPAATVADPTAPVTDPTAPVTDPTAPIADVPTAADVAPYAETIRRIVTASLKDGRAYAMLADLVSVAPHRLTGSPGGMAAIEWARQQMESLGLSNVRLQAVQANHWERGSLCELRFAEPPELAGERLAVIALGGSVATPALGITAEVVVVDGLDAVDALGDTARGKLVLFNGPMDDSLVDTFSAYGGAVGQRAHGASRAAKVGAVGALVRSMTTRIDDNPHTGGMRYADDTARIPTAAVSTIAAERIAALVADGRRVVLNLRQDCAWKPQVTTYNVIGELRGREHPEEILVVGGHLDAWDVGQGAHDDGGGCCQALEAVRLLSSLDLQPRRTIRVVLFGNEENGLAGGRGYRDAHLDEMPNHLLALESDSGVFTPRGFETNANPQARAVLQAITDVLGDAAGAGVLGTSTSGGADVSPMRGDGVIQVGYLPDPHRYFDLHHSEADTLEAVNPREINLGAGVIAALLYVVADLPTAIPRNPVEGEG